MPWTCEIDAAGLLIVHASGVVTEEDIRFGAMQVTGTPGFRDVRHFLLDYSEATNVSITVDRVRGLAQNPMFGPDTRRAFHAGTSDLAYGMGRMYQACAEHARTGAVEVFRDRDEALRWLRG